MMQLTRAGAYVLRRILMFNPSGQAVVRKGMERCFEVKWITIDKLLRDGALEPIRGGEYVALTRAGYDAYRNSPDGLWEIAHNPRFLRPFRMERTDLIGCQDLHEAP